MEGNIKTQSQNGCDLTEEKCVTQSLIIVLLIQYVYINTNCDRYLFLTTMYVGGTSKHNKMVLQVRI